MYTIVGRVGYLDTIGVTVLEKLLLSIVFIFLLITGCSNGETKDLPAEEKVVEAAESMNSDVAVEEDKSSGTTKEESQIVVNETTEPIYEINPQNWSVKPIKDANERVVLLTIDDAPDKYALDMAKTLKSLGVKAIFFVNGHFINTPEEAAILKEIFGLGFPIGNHTLSHRNLSDLTKEDTYTEIVSLNDRIEEIIGERPKFFRAPFGVNTDESRKIAEEEKMLIMNWTYGYDWEKDYQTKEAIADIMVNSPYLTNGANLLMHDRNWTSEALEDIVKGLQQKNYEIVDPNLIRTPE